MGTISIASRPGTEAQFCCTMPKALESLMNLSPFSSRRIQFRSMSWTRALILALLFVFAALSTAFILFQ